MWRLVFILFLLPAVSWAAGPAWKSNSTPGYTTTTTGRVNLNPLPPGPLADLISQRQYAPNVSEGSVLLRDLLTKTPGPKGPSDLQILLERKATGKALATAMARSLPLVSTAIAVGEVLDAMGCKIGTTTIIECKEDWQEEAGDGGNRWCVVGASVSTCFDSLADGKRHYVDFLNSNLPGTVRGVKYTVGACVEGQGSSEFNKFIVCTPTIGDAFVYCPAQGSGCWVTNGANLGPSGGRYLQLVGPGPEVRCQGEALDGGCLSRPSPDEFGDKASNHPAAKPKLPGLAPPLDAGGVDYDTEGPPKVSGPAVIPGAREETRQNPDGSTTTRDRDYPTEYSGPGDEPWYEWDIRDTTKTWPPGTTPDPYVPGGGSTPPPGGSSSTTTTTVEVTTCGLPNTPPCKIDESGTPQWDAGDPAARANDLFAGLKACVTTPSSCLPSLPSINWAFALPTGCSAIPLPAFAPFLTELDVCQFQPTIHDVMSVLWVAAGLFAAVQLVFRDSVGG